MRINNKPHEGINEVSFGLSSKEVRIKLGVPESSREKTSNQFGDVSIPEPKTDYYFNNSLQISYDDTDTVEFIEMACMDAKLQLSIYGYNINRHSADEIISFLTKEKNLEYDKSGIELPYSYEFIDKDLTFWRQTIPEVEKDKEGHYFDTIGIGKVGYLAQNE